MAAITGDYQFSAEPRTVKAKVGKYRDQEESNRPVNIMIDKRVVRGNTFASMMIPPSTQQEIEKKQQQDRRQLSQIQGKEKTTSREGEREVSTPEPIEGRQHIDVQTENIPEELSEKPVEFEIEVQTDYYIDRPPTPLLMPKKIGEDVDTQVEDGELFDFDIEVDPILEVLIGKTLEIGRMEVLEEEELNAMKLHQHEFEQKRRNELSEVQRLEGEEIRKREESKRRKIEAKTKKENMQFAHKKYISRIMAKKFLSGLSATAFEDLKALGTYSDIQEISFHDQLLPWIVSSTESSLTLKTSVNETLNSILHESFNHLKALHYQALQNQKIKKENERLAAIQQEKDEETRRKNRVQMRIQKKIEQELKLLKNKIDEKIVSTGVLVEKATSNIFSDIDGRQVENIIGTPGGLFGELIHLFSVLEEILAITLTQDQINNLFLHDFIPHTMKSPFLTYTNLSEQRFGEFLKSLGKAGLSIENLNTSGEDVKSAVLSYLLNPSNGIEGTSLTIMWKNYSMFGIREGLIESILTAFFNVLTLKDIDATHPNPTRLKTELKPTELYDHKEIAVIRIKIPLVDDGEGGLAEALDDKAVLINPTNEDLSVFVIHQAAQRLLRNELTYWIKTIRAYETIDLEHFRASLNAKSQANEEKILEIVAKGLPVFDFQI
jgi:radial spoke head protein 3